MGFAALQVERDGDTIRITMNRPERRNALSADHLVELREVVTEEVVPAVVDGLPRCAPRPLGLGAMLTTPLTRVCWGSLRAPSAYGVAHLRTRRSPHGESAGGRGLDRGR